MPSKSLTALALPLIFSFTVRFMFTLVDMIYVRAIDEEVPNGVAAIAMFIPIQGIFIALWAGLSSGFTANLSQAFGRQDEDRIRQLKRGMMWVLAGLIPFSLALGGIVYLWIDAKTSLPADLRRDALTYCLILVLTSPYTSFLSIYPDSIVKAHHATKATAMAGIASTVANLVLNTLFVFGFGWGIAGIALATAISRWAGFAYAARVVARLEGERLADPSWDQGSTNWERGPKRDILVLALPASLTFFLVAGQNFLVNDLLTREENGAILLGAYGIYERLLSLVLMPVIATGVAVLPFVARLLPQAQQAAIRQNLLRSGMHIAALVMLIAIPTCWLFAEPISSFFLPKKAPTAALELAPVYLSLVPVLAVLTMPFLLLRPVFDAARRPRLSTWMTVQKVVLLETPLLLLGYYLSQQQGFDPFLGILLGLGCGGLLASVLTIAAARGLLGDTPPSQVPDPQPD